MLRIDKKQLATHPLLKAEKQVAHICKPLFQRFNLNFFSQLRCYNDGSVTMLTTEGELFRNIILDNIAISNNISESFPPGYYFWEDTERLSSAAKRRSIKQLNIAKEGFGINEGFMIVEQSSTEWTDIYDFGAPREKTDAKNFYLNNIDILQRHISYFQDQGALLFKLLDTRRLQLFPPIRILRPTENHDSALTSFLQETRIRRLHSSHIANPLNKRELESLLFTLMGKSSTETAEILNVSTKTVQGYIGVVKHKLGCNKRSELFRRAIELGLLQVANLL